MVLRGKEGGLAHWNVNTATFADGACEARSRQEEEDDAWPSSTTTNAEIVRNPHLPYGWRRDAPISLSLLLQDTRNRVRRRFANSPRALVTNVTVFMKRCTKGSVKNNFTFWHLIFTPSSAAPQSQNPQRRTGYACGFPQSFAAKSGANLSANSAKLFLTEPLDGKRT